MNKKILFLLGGSPLQIDLLRKAKERYNVVVIDGNPDCYLRSEADEFIHLDFSDTEKLEALAKQKQPALILTMASEPGNLAAAIVSARLNLTYNTPDVVHTTINKLHMKQRLADSRIATASYLSVTGVAERPGSLEGFAFPLVVKPAQSSAGRGVRLVSNSTELTEAIALAKAISKDGCALIEEFISGAQYSIETISCSGQHTILGITHEHFGPPPYFAETQQMFPAPVDEATAAQMHRLVRHTLNAFNIQYGACHIEVRVTSEGEIFIIEIASRIGGWRSELIRKATGIEYCELLLQAHEGVQPKLERTREKYCLVKMLFNQKDLDLEHSLDQNPIYTISQITWLKDTISQTQCSLMDSAGYYFVEANTIKDALNAL